MCGTMELKLLSKDKSSIEVEVDGVDEAMLHLLVEQLQNDSEVADALYIMGHPHLDKPRIFVTVKSGKPQTALKRAAKNLSNRFEKMHALFSKAVKDIT